MKLSKHEMAILKGSQDEPPARIEGITSMARRYGMCRNTLRGRLRAGMSMEEAVSKPAMSHAECGRLGARAKWSNCK